VTSSTTVPTESTVWSTPVVTFETTSVRPVSGPPADAGPTSERLKIAAIDATTARLGEATPGMLGYVPVGP
jgi:hypothetical protein